MEVNIIRFDFWFLRESIKTVIKIKCDVKAVVDFHIVLNKDLQAFLLDLKLKIFLYFV